jgi:hypothetical protein
MRFRGNLETLLAFILGRFEVRSEELVPLGRFCGELSKERRVGRIGLVALMEPGSWIAGGVLSLKMRNALNQIGDDLPARWDARRP